MKKTVIIIDGCDNIGKSYLAHNICDNYGATYLHFGPPDPPTLQGGEQVFYKAWIDVLASPFQYTVMDRSPFGEWVYCKYRKYNAWKWMEQARKCVRALDMLQIIFVVIYADKLPAGVTPKSDEKNVYQTEQAMRLVSIDFLKVLHAFRDTGIMRILINNNNYASLDERNAYIKALLGNTIKNKQTLNEII